MAKQKLTKMTAIQVRDARREGRTDFGCIKLTSGSLEGENLFGCTFMYSNLRGAKLHSADLRCTDFSSADLTAADLSEARLDLATLRGTLLRNVAASHANFTGANLLRADMRDGNFSSSIFIGADLEAAQLQGARLRGVDLRRADVRGTPLGPMVARPPMSLPHGLIAHPEDPNRVYGFVLCPNSEGHLEIGKTCLAGAFSVDTESSDHPGFIVYPGQSGPPAPAIIYSWLVCEAQLDSLVYVPCAKFYRAPRVKPLFAYGPAVSNPTILCQRILHSAANQE